MKKTLLLVLLAALFATSAVAQTKKEDPKPATKPSTSTKPVTPGESNPALPPAKPAAKPAGKASPKLELKTEAEKISYSLGADIGARLKELKTDLDMKVFMRGLEDKMKDAELALSAEEQTAVKQAFFNKKKEEAQAEAKALGEKNRSEGEAFLAENKTKPGVQTTASGLQYMVLQEGTGAMPKATDKVKVHYRGTLLNGTEFDSSFKRGEPAVFPCGGVIKGWTEALQLMKVGAKYKLFIPAGLAYGDRGAGKDIGPNATLIFEVELVAIEEPAAPAAPASAPGSASQAPGANPSAPEAKPVK